MPARFSPLRALRRIGLAPWFAVGVLTVGLLVNASHSLIDNLVRNTFGITSPVGGTLATFGVVVLIGLAIIVLVALLAPAPLLRSPVTPHSGEALPPKRRGLILLVSNPDSALFAIKHHLLAGPLEKVWLVPSHGHDAAFFGPGSAPTAVEIKKRAEELAAQQGRALVVVIDPRGVSPANAQETYDCVRGVFRQGPLPPEDVIADFTGGTKPMTVGMIMACLNAGRELEYVSLHPPTKTMHGPFLIDYRPEAFDLKREGA
jgi:hypothetical protein